MKIAQIAPLWESVPPMAYGGIELVVGLLTDELVRRGHDVTLFASGDSKTLAKLQPMCSEALRLKEVGPAEYAVYEQMQLSQVFNRAGEFDIIHSHVGHPVLPYVDLVKTPVVHTLHLTFSQLLDGALIERVFCQHRNQNFVSISEAQQRLDLGLNYVATVHNAIALENFTYQPQAQQPPYLAFLGRLSPEKGPDTAIRIARQAGWKLKMAGKVDPLDRIFFEQVVKPQIDGDQIEFLGEISQAEKQHLLGGATATLMPINWEEPFGLVMIESMATGTPVIVTQRGAAPEIVVSGETGFLCRTEADFVAALGKVDQIQRQACRDRVRNSFSVSHMVDGYEQVYQSLVFNQNARFRAATSDLSNRRPKPISPLPEESGVAELTAPGAD